MLIDYEHLKTILTEKYGTPSDSQEKFTGYVGDYDNGLVMHAIKDGEYQWLTTFSTTLGRIELSIKKGTSYGTAMICLAYYDKINSEKARNTAMDDL